jgi:4-amino-4-deoxy-L-arabinose transferase-like glycosyltransferase
MAAVLGILLATVWVQPAGAPLVEHDETRYAEIAREMLATGDYIVPHLNGVPWYEKPPLLFWAGAASMQVFGPTPWAARLPSRLAGLGTIALLLLWVAREGDRRRAILAAMIALGSPLGWGIAFLNIADGMLTFLLTAAILGGHVAMRRESARERNTVAFAAGVAAGGAFLTKGLIGFLFPAAILAVWAVLVRRPRPFVAAAAAGSLGAAALALPWVAVVAQRCPEYLEVFIVREHFQRYASAIHQRQEPLFFAALIFLAALAPVLGKFFSALLGRHAPFSESEKLLVVWFASIVLFFSFSRSQLVSYVAPAVPAASAFIALRFGVPGLRAAAWLLQAALATGLVVAASLDQRLDLVHLTLQARFQVIVGAGVLVAAVWSAVVVARRDEWRAAAVTFAGCAVAYAGLVAAWPAGGAAREMAALRASIVHVRQSGDVDLVSYRTFMKGLPWLLRSPVPVVDPGGELAAGVLTIAAADSPLLWTEERFWLRWRSDGKVLALVNERGIDSFERTAGSVPFIVARARRHLLVSNFDPSLTPSADPAVSTALYAATAESSAVPLASLPERVADAARLELAGATIVRGLVEQTRYGPVYEVATGGPRPRLVEIDPGGTLVYTEELVELRMVPGIVLAALEREAPALPVAFVKHERLLGGAPDRYEFFVADGRSLRELEIDGSGRVID